MQYLIIFLISVLLGQDINSDALSDKSTTTGSMGSVTINGQIYNQISIRPEIPIGKLGVGLDLYLYFNDDGMYWESWDFSTGAAAYRTIVDKIYYLKWGNPGDDLYALGGALSSVTLGQGILVNNYSNIMEYPQVRQIGLNLNANVLGAAIELIHSNFKSVAPSVFGIRGSYSIIPKLNLGVSFVTDMNQMAGLPDSDGDGYPDYYDDYPNESSQYNYAWETYLANQEYWDELCDGVTDEDCLINNLKNGLGDDYNDYNPASTAKDPISGISLDVEYSLSEKIVIYSQIAQLIGETFVSHLETVKSSSLGWGAVPVGLKAKLGIFNLMAEYRINSRRFIFNYWDRAYDLNRVTLNGSDVPITKASQLYQFGQLSGFYAQVNMSLMDLANLSLGYQNMQGEKWNNSLGDYNVDESNQTLLSTARINPSLIPKIGKAEVFYQQSNVSNPFEFIPNASTILGYNLGFEISPGIMLVYQGRTTYISDLDNPGEFKPVKSVQIETQFVF